MLNDFQKIRSLLYIFFLSACGASLATAQVANYYAISTLAGNSSSGDGEAATNALLASPLGAAADADGNIFFIDQRNYGIRRISPTGILSTVALVPNALDLAVDRLSGDLVVITRQSIHRVTVAGGVTQIAGGRSAGSSGDGGPAANALVAPYSVTVDTKGVIYFAEADYNRVRRIGTDGIISAFAGTGTFGFGGDGGPAAQARLYFPTGVAADANGFVFISDYFNGRLRRVTPGGVIATYAGSGFLGQPVDGPVSAATRFGGLGNLSIDRSGNLLICDVYWDMVYRISADGALRVLAGTGVTGFGGDGGSGRGALLDSPFGVAGLADGSVVIADARNDRMRKVAASDGRISTIAGRNHFGGDGGQATQATLNRPGAVVRSSTGQFYISDRGNNRIRRVDLDGTIRTIAGTGRRGSDGDNGPAQAALLNGPLHMVIAPDDTIYFIDSGNLKVRRVSPTGTITTVAGSGERGDTGDGGPASAARFLSMTGLALDGRNNLFIADGTANKIRRVTLGNGVIDTYAGGGTGGTGEGGLATSARLGYPADLAVDGRNRLYVAEISYGVIRRIETTGIISQFAGDGGQGAAVAGAPAKQTGIGLNTGMALDSSGNLLLLSSVPNRVYVVSAATGAITTLAGGGPALSASLSFPLGLIVTPDGAIYVADTGNDRVRKLTVNNPAKLEISAGNNQQGGTGQPAAAALRVKLTGAAGVGIGGITIAFRIVSGGGTLSAFSAPTDASGVAGLGYTFGAAAGPVRVEASAVGVPPVIFDLTGVAGVGGAGAPIITSVITAGAFGGKALIAPGSWVEIYGSNLANETREWGGGDFNGSTAPVALAGVRVRVNGQAASIRFISPGQINAQVPAGVVLGTASVDVSNADGTSAPYTIASAAIAPALLAPPNFVSAGKQLLVGILPDNTFAGPRNLLPGVTFRPIVAGERIVFYGVGFGAVTPAVAPGQIAPTAGSAIAGLSVRIGGKAAALEYGGLAGGFVGLYQFNVATPEGLNGDQRLEVFVGSTPLDQQLWLTFESTGSGAGAGTASAQPPQMDDGFQMRRLREQIGQGQPLNRVSLRQ